MSTKSLSAKKIVQDATSKGKGSSSRVLMNPYAAKRSYEEAREAKLPSTDQQVKKYRKKADPKAATATRTISAKQFKTQCLEVMDEVAKTGTSVIITKHGKPVAQLTSMMQKPKTLFGFLKGSIQTTGDIISPVDLDWDAER